MPIAPDACWLRPCFIVIIINVHASQQVGKSRIETFEQIVKVACVMMSKVL